MHRTIGLTRGTGYTGILILTLTLVLSSVSPIIRCISETAYRGIGGSDGCVTPL